MLETVAWADGIMGNQKQGTQLFLNTSEAAWCLHLEGSFSTIGTKMDDMTQSQFKKKKMFSFFFLFPHKCKHKTQQCVWEDKAPAGLLQNSLFLSYITNLC